MPNLFLTDFQKCLTGMTGEQAHKGLSADSSTLYQIHFMSVSDSVYKTNEVERLLLPTLQYQRCYLSEKKISSFQINSY